MTFLDLMRQWDTCLVTAEYQEARDLYLTAINAKKSFEHDKSVLKDVFYTVSFQCGKSYENMGNYSLAFLYYQKCLALDNCSFETYERMWHVLNELWLHKERSKFLKKAKALSPQASLSFKERFQNVLQVFGI